MGKSVQVGENMFVLPVDMENRSVEDIAREAASSILEVCEQVGRQRESEKSTIAMANGLSVEDKIRDLNR